MNCVRIGQPATRRRLVKLAGMAALGLALLVGGALMIGREPRFEGRTTVEWLDALGPIDLVTNVADFRGHAVRQQLAGVAPRFASALEKTFRRQARDLTSLRKRRYWMANLWARASRILPRGFALPSPDPTSNKETLVTRRLQWIVAWVVDSSGDAETGVGRLDGLMGAVPPNLSIEAALGFRALRGREDALAQALVRRLRSGEGDPNRRSWWIACLGNLGEQPVDAADLVRSLARDSHPGVRGEAIKALGSVDVREDTVEFIQTCARDPVGRQSALIAFLRMGSRARPAESFILAAHSDPDVLTRLFAQWALKAIGPGADDAGPDPAGGSGPESGSSGAR